MPALRNFIVGLLLSSLLLIPDAASARTLSSVPCKVKFHETGLKYTQLDRGYFQGYFSLWREVGLAYMPTFLETEIALGYSPWRSAMNAEINSRLVLMILSLGGGIGYAATTDFSQNAFFIKPEVGLNLSVVQIYYTYSFVNPNNNLYTMDSNLTVAIPIASTTHFGSCQATKHWRMWGVIRSVFRGEKWQIWE